MPRVLVASARRAGAVVAAVALLALTACTGGGGETVTPTPDESPTAVVTESPSPSPTPTALTEEDVLAALPEQALTEDLPGAVMFAQFYLVESQEVLRDFDTSLFEFVSSDSCNFCDAVVAGVADVENRELSMEGGALTVDTSAPYGGLQEDGTWYVQLPIAVEEQMFLDSDGQVVRENNALEATAVVLLERNGNQWSVLEVDTL